MDGASGPMVPAQKMMCMTYPSYGPAVAKRFLLPFRLSNPQASRHVFSSLARPGIDPGCARPGRCRCCSPKPAHLPPAATAGKPVATGGAPVLPCGFVARRLPAADRHRWPLGHTPALSAAALQRQLQAFEEFANLAKILSGATHHVHTTCGTSQLDPVAVAAENLRESADIVGNPRLREALERLASRAEKSRQE